MLEQLSIGSRPSKRNKSKDVKSLRAIPWVFAWTQIRFLLPAWLGIYEALNFAIKNKNINILKEESWNVLWVFIKDFVESYSKQQDILLLVDEYDKPVNDCLKNKKHELACKDNVLEELKDKLYRYFKDIPCITLITGINKLSMASFFSDFNNLKDYSKFISLWYTEQEVKDLFSRVWLKYTEEVKRWYNGYRFSERIIEYNPWAVNLFLEWSSMLWKAYFTPYWSKTGTTPSYFRYLANDILKVKNFDEYLNLIKKYTYDDKIINLETMNEMNVATILHYFYYAGLLTFDEKMTFAIPNNDVIKSYEDLLFADTYTEYYMNLRLLASDAVEQLADEKTEKLREFIIYLLREKYVNHDKTDLWKLGEQVITSDIGLILKTFVRLDLRREVNILEWRTDLEYIDINWKKVLFEFKVAKTSSEVESKKKEWNEQIKKYGWYDYKYLIIIDLEKVEVIIIK